MTRSQSRRAGSSLALGIERRRGAADDDPDQGQSDAPDEQSAEEGVDDPGEGAAQLLVGDLVLADHPREHPGADDQVEDRDQRSRPGDRDRRPQHADPPIAREGDRCDQHERREDRRDHAQQPHPVGDHQRLGGELALLQLRQLQVQILGDLVGDLWVDRVEREADDLEPVGDVEGDVLLALDEQQPVRLPGRLAEDLAKRRRVDHGRHHLLDQWPGGDQVRRPALDQLDDDLGRRHVANPVVRERLDGVVGERILVDDLRARVEQQYGGDREQRADHRKRDARAVTPSVWDASPLGRLHRAPRSLSWNLPRARPAKLCRWRAGG